MIASSLRWIDWKLAPKAMFRESAGRFFLLFLLGSFFTAMLLSGGLNRFLSERWPVTAILRLSVPAAEGQGIAGKAAGLPGVLSAVYRDPEMSWKEFLAAYPGMESLRVAGGNPLPGYVEVRMRPEKFTEGGIRAVEAVLRPLPQVDKILTGGDALSRLLRVGGWMNAILWGGFVLLCFCSFSIFRLQEKARTVSLSADLEFLRERGVPARSIMASRASGAMLTGLLLSLAAMGAAVSVLNLLESRLPLFVRVIGRAEDVLAMPYLVPAVLFLSASALGSGAASLLGWRAAQSGRK
jgi:cell division protein FtsX